MELELRRLEDLAESIVNDFAYMRAREEEMRDTNGGCSDCHSSCNFLFVGRIDQLESVVLWSVLYAVSAVPGRLADILSPQILSSKETYRMILVTP